MENLVRGIPLYFLIPIAAILTALVSFVVIKALREGREITFWPPKIGPRSSSGAGPNGKSDVSARNPEVSEPSKINWHNHGSIFWIGYDLRETLAAILNYDSREAMLRCLGQVNHHAKSLGFDSLTDHQSMLFYAHDPSAPTTWGYSETITARVSRIMIEVEQSTEKALTTKKRKEWADQIREIGHLIDKLAKESSRA